MSHIALALADGPAHGYRLITEIERLSDGAIQIGAATMYRSLRRMLAAGQGVEDASGSPPHHDERRRYYRLTDEGLRALARETRRLAGLVDAAVTRGVPECFHTLNPQLTVPDADAASAFYEAAFEAKELFRNAAPDGRIAHVQLVVGGSIHLLNEAFPEHGTPSPADLGGTPVSIYLYVAHADLVFDRVVRAGASVVHPVADRFWGDRFGMVTDPFGHRWATVTRDHDPSPAEIRRRSRRSG